VACYGWNPIYDFKYKSAIARMFWYFPFQMCSFVLIFTLIFAICRMISKESKYKSFWQEYSFLMILCITGLCLFLIYSHLVLYIQKIILYCFVIIGI
jgi:magnesium-transporting ATPase (P-type)